MKLSGNQDDKPFGKRPTKFTNLVDVKNYLIYNKEIIESFRPSFFEGKENDKHFQLYGTPDGIDKQVEFVKKYTITSIRYLDYGDIVDSMIKNDGNIVGEVSVKFERDFINGRTGEVYGRSVMHW